MAHTPGPWIVETVRTSCGLCHKIGSPDVLAAKSYACVYDDHTIDNPSSPETALANARLIAAAPTMLEALERILPMAMGLFPEGGAYEAAIAGARTAIAIATE